MKYRSIIGFGIGFMISTIGFWLWGMDFTERGKDMVFWYVESIASGLMGICIANFSEP